MEGFRVRLPVVKQQKSSSAAAATRLLLELLIPRIFFLVLGTNLQH
jgi:hypothetical protein